MKEFKIKNELSGSRDIKLDDELNRVRQRVVVPEISKIKFTDHLNDISSVSLSLPWIDVSHYFTKIGICRRSSDSEFVRHNYEVNDDGNLTCIHDNHSLDSPYVRCKSDIIRRRREKKDLLKAEEFKAPGDITIYRMYWTKNGIHIWLPFPGFGYNGQTIEMAKDRVFRSDGHIRLSFRRPQHEIHRLIKENFPNEKLAKKYIKYEVLKIIKFQGNWQKFEEIEDDDKRKEEIEKAHKKTQDLADLVEKFWIGFYHYQYPEFGGNYEEGGSDHGRSFEVFPYETINDILNNVIYFSIFAGPKRILTKELGLNYPTQEGKIDVNIQYWYGTKNFMEIYHKKQYKVIRELFEKGYSVQGIAEYFNKKAGSHKSPNIEYFSDVLKQKIFTRFPEDTYIRKIQAEILLPIIIKYMKKGYDSYLSLLEVLPGFDRDIDEIKSELVESGKYSMPEEIPTHKINEKRSHRIQGFFRTYYGPISELKKKYGLERSREQLWEGAVRLIKEKGSMRGQNEFTKTDFLEEMNLPAKSGFRKVCNTYFGVDYNWMEFKRLVLAGKLPPKDSKEITLLSPLEWLKKNITAENLKEILVLLSPNKISEILGVNMGQIKALAQDLYRIDLTGRDAGYYISIRRSIEYNENKSPYYEDYSLWEKFLKDIGKYGSKSF